jgi:hypothetical protein
MAKKKPKIEPEVVEEVVQKPKTFDMFAKKKDTTFIAMTKEASMMADESHSKRKNVMPSRIKSCIHKIREDQ